MTQLKQLFPDFDEALITQINKIAQIKEFKANDVLVRKGQYIKSVMLVLKGNIKIYSDDDEGGGEFFMYELLPGQACAVSMTCASQSEKSRITAIATEDTVTLTIPISMMEILMAEHKNWYRFVVATYRSRYNELLNALDQVAFRSMDERLEFFLKRQAKNNTSNLINMSHQQIATDLNSSREVVSRLLKKMEQRGLIKLNRNQIEVLDVLQKS